MAQDEQASSELTEEQEAPQNENGAPQKKKNPIAQLFESGAAIGIILFLMAVIAMIWVNSPWGGTYKHLWHVPFKLGFEGTPYVLEKSLHHWINDGLMAIFFFVIGLEIKRELIAGELSSVRKAMLPAGAALGGMVVPALIYFAFNPSGLASNGWGVPMATDIAFSLGLLTLVKSRVPVAVKVFLAGLAIVDDLGAVLVIALFYTSQISFISLGFALLGLIVLLIANRMQVRNVAFYGVVGIGVIWFSFLMSGVHATLAGVVAAFTIPASVKVDEKSFVDKLKKLGKEMELSTPQKGAPLITHHQLLIIDRVKKLGKDADTPLQRLEHKLDPFVSYFVMPLFALANAGVELPNDILAVLFHPVSLGCMSGLLVGKFVGIGGACKLLVRAGLASLPRNTAWPHIYGAALMAGIGFTMSLFITNLAYTPDYLTASPIAQATTEQKGSDRITLLHSKNGKDLPKKHVKNGDLYKLSDQVKKVVVDSLSISKEAIEGKTMYFLPDMASSDLRKKLDQEIVQYTPEKKEVRAGIDGKIRKGGEYEKFAKVGILTGSLIAMTLGLLLLRFGTPDPDPEEEEEEH